MHGYVLQDWLTVGAIASAVGNMIQDDADWLDLGPYKDLQVWLDVVEFDATAGSATLTIETAALREDYWFSTLETFSISGTGVTVRSEMADYIQGIAHAMPLARWVRWKLAMPTALSNLTFRILVAAGGVGTGQVPNRLISRLTEEWPP